MSTVTYHHQPGIHKSRGAVPLAGTAHVYKVEKLLWPREVEEYIRGLFVGRVLHVCSGMSQLGDVRLDMFQPADVKGDAARLPFASRSFDTILCDPPYNGVFRWNHDLLSELVRVADKRVVFQHWFIPANKNGQYKKCFEFELREVANWMGRTYFGRVQVISTFDRITS